ncbi:MAG: SDR family oxidoreductase [Rhodospirillaceae bacterium]
MTRFANQVVWVTGASSGIGEALVYAFAREGAHVVLSGRREVELQRVASTCTNRTGQVFCVPFDMLDENGRKAAVERVLSRFGHIDMLVNNAGVSQRSLGKDTALSVDRAIMELDYMSVIALTKLVLPHMLERGSGYLVATSSVAGKYGVPMRTAYSAAKHALHGFFDALRAELAGDNINISLLVIAGVQSQVSVNALTGDGSTWGKMDSVQSRGLTAEDCADIVLDGLAKGEPEINVGRGAAMKALWLKRFFPKRLHKMMTKARTT